MICDHDDVWVTQHADHIEWAWVGDTGYALVQREVLEMLLAKCNEPTYAAGVQAARDAVEALPWTPTFTDLWVIDKADALVAIEALKEQP